MAICKNVRVFVVLERNENPRDREREATPTGFHQQLKWRGETPVGETDSWELYGPPLPPPASYIKAGPTVRLHHRHRPAVDSNTTLLFSLAKWKKKLNNKNGEGNRKHPQISVSVIVRPGRQSSQADDRRRASGDPDVPEQTPPTGSQHAQEPQSLQGGSHQQRHRLHLRPPDGLARSAPPESIKQQQQRRRRQQLRPAHHHGHVAGRLPDLLNPQKRKTVIATTSGRTITCDNYLKNRRPLYIILLSLHTYYLPTCLSRNTKKKHGKFLPVSYHHTNKHSSFLFSNGLDAFCVSSLASGVARVFLMAHTHRYNKDSLNNGPRRRPKDMMQVFNDEKKKKREGTLWAQMVHQVLKKKTDVLRVLPRWPWEINVDEEFSSFSKKTHAVDVTRPDIRRRLLYSPSSVAQVFFFSYLGGSLSVCGGMWTFGRGYLLIRETRKSASSTCLQYVHRESTERAPRSIMLRCW